MKISKWFDWYDRLKNVIINKILSLPKYSS